MTSEHQQAITDTAQEEIFDTISEAIADSIDMDWQPRDGARSVMDRLSKEGLFIVPLSRLRRSAWLVERPAGPNDHARWWNPTHGWMIDANKGVQFVRKEDAEDYRMAMRFGDLSITTEHMWIGDEYQGSATPCEFITGAQTTPSLAVAP